MNTLLAEIETDLGAAKNKTHSRGACVGDCAKRSYTLAGAVPQDIPLYVGSGHGLESAIKRAIAGLPAEHCAVLFRLLLKRQL